MSNGDYLKDLPVRGDIKYVLRLAVEWVLSKQLRKSCASVTGGDVGFE